MTPEREIEIRGKSAHSQGEAWADSVIRDLLQEVDRLRELTRLQSTGGAGK